MPELPEVETIVRRLRSRLVGRVIESIAILLEKSWIGEVEDVVGEEVVEVKRRAKMIIIKLASDRYLLIHLKMTGQLIYVAKDNQRLGGGHPTADWVATLPSKHTRVIIKLNDGSNLFFNDMRTFGWIKSLDQAELDAELSKYGPDINDPKFTQSLFKNALINKTVNIKQAIMNNQLVAGVGNIYACDGLHLAGLSPTRSAESLSQIETKTLYLALQEVIGLGIKLGGATISDYTDVDGFAGKYQTVCRVYGREDQPCQVCQTKIKRIKQGGRSTFYCPKCQK